MARRALAVAERDARVPLLDGVSGQAIEALTWVGRWALPVGERERGDHGVPRAAAGGIRSPRDGGRSGRCRSRGGPSSSRMESSRRGRSHFHSLTWAWKPSRTRPARRAWSRSAPGAARSRSRSPSGRPDSTVYGIDVSHRAVAWARRNGRRLDVENVRFLHGSLLESSPGFGGCSRLAGCREHPLHPSEGWSCPGRCWAHVHDHGAERGTASRSSGISRGRRRMLLSPVAALSSSWRIGNGRSYRKSWTPSATGSLTIVRGFPRSGSPSGAPIDELPHPTGGTSRDRGWRGGTPTTRTPVSTTS